jgi:glycosyltransferase involved in cell wall biosynthesis
MRKLIVRAKDDSHRRIRKFTETFRSARDLGFGATGQFRRERKSAEYVAAYEKPDPLVTICIATYNRAQLLRERSLRSAMEQTHRNIEIIVVGDACTDETAEVMAQVTDLRVRFVNLAQRGDYPDDPRLRWMVAGTAPVNHALSIARGDFITHLDDDDEHAPERVEQLLSFIRETRADLVFHPYRYELDNGEWLINDAEYFDLGQVTSSSIFYHHCLRRIPWDPNAYRYLEPGDWNRLRKIAFLGAKALRHPNVLLSHYREHNQQRP